MPNPVIDVGRLPDEGRRRFSIGTPTVALDRWRSRVHDASRQRCRALLADPDLDPADGGRGVHDAAVRVNQARLADDERAFRSGGLDTAAVRERLGASRQAVNERVRNASLLAVKVGSRLVFPGWQFCATGLAPSLSEVLSALRGVAGDDVRQADAIMRVPQPDLPDAASLADLLDAGDANEVVRRLVARADQS